uniref:motile sperm domain-containing protein 2-like n=1 Tax=Styela clava TaxID=7725 RepID=UPI00193952B7|nr:motile sperm domain-containing protein 2-like [Styela clava]
MATAASGGNDDSKMIAELREKFNKKFVDPPSARLAKFDEHDVMRIHNDDLFALSFLHWKKEVIDDAVELAASCLEWRKENGMRDISVESIGQKYMEKGVIYIYGRDLEGHRVMCLIGRMQNKDEKDQIRQLLMFWLERLQRYEPGQHVTFILDTNKTAMGNVDLGLIRFIIDSFTSYFPDLLEKIIILDMPWIMNAIWNIVKQWMSEEQRSKTVFCSRKDLKKYISPDQLPKSMAGTVDWTYSFPPFPDDLGQDHDFKNDPNNFKKKEEKAEEKPGPSTTTDAVPLVNGEVTQERSPDNGDFNNNNHNTDESSSTTNVRKIMPVKKLAKNPPVEKKVAYAENGESQLPVTKSSTDMDMRTSTPIKQDPSLKKSSGQEQQSNGQITGSEKVKPQRPNTTDGKLEKHASNVSFQSVKGMDESRNDAMPRIDSRIKVETDEILLGNQLVMSPVSELTFKLEGERLEGYMRIRNPNPVTDFEDRVYVAYKVKTTSPERYHVKPSVGVVSPGESIQIRIYLETGHESAMPKDRFLLLYKQIPVKDGKSLTHGEIVKFWKQNSDKSSHFEHRLRVKVDDPKVLTRQQSKDSAQASVILEDSGSQFHSLGEKTPSSGTEISQLQQQIGLLTNKISRLENDSRWMRRRMRHMMGLLFIVIILLFFLLYEITMVSYSLSSANQSCSSAS